MLLQKLKYLLSNNNRPSILVIGDLMIDHYIWGDCTRISPEAPVPIINVVKETSALGGAANVAHNLIAYGAAVTISGLIGNDNAGRIITSLLNERAVETSALYVDNGRVTTEKTRVIAGNHHITRIDRELNHPIASDVEDELFNKLKPFILKADIVLFSDYNKGLFTQQLAQLIIDYCNANYKKVVIDPKGLNYLKYKDAFLIKPNRKELAEAAKVDKITNHETLEKAARKVLAETNAQYLVVTLSEDGIALFSENEFQIFPVKVTEVFDVTGAGDTVLATLAFFLANGFSVAEACEYANHAAAIVVRHVGSAVTTLNQLIEDLEKVNN